MTASLFPVCCYSLCTRCRPRALASLASRILLKQTTRVSYFEVPQCQLWLPKNSPRQPGGPCSSPCAAKVTLHPKPLAGSGSLCAVLSGSGGNSPARPPTPPQGLLTPPKSIHVRQKKKKRAYHPFRRRFIDRATISVCVAISRPCLSPPLNLTLAGAQGTPRARRVIASIRVAKHG